MCVLLLCGLAWGEAQLPYLSLFPRNSLPLGEDLHFTLAGVQDLENQDVYVRVLLRASDGMLSTVTRIKAWDAAASSAVEVIPGEYFTQTGEYVLTACTDPDYAGADEAFAAVASFTVLQEQLAAPTFSNITHGANASSDVSADYTAPEGAAIVYLTLGYLNHGSFEELAWEEGLGGSFSVLGFNTSRAGTYQIRAIALAPHFLDEPSTTTADSEMTIYEFTLEEAAIPSAPVLTVSGTEFDWDEDQTPSVNCTIAGADKVAIVYSFYHPVTGEDLGGVGTPNSATEGDTESVLFDGGPGVYRINGWGCYDGVWSEQSNTVSVTVNPLGYLDAPTVLCNGNAVSERVTLSSGDPMVFQATSAGAVSIQLEILQDVSADGTGLYYYFDSMEQSLESGAFDLGGLQMPLGIYQLWFSCFRDGWLGAEDMILYLTVEEPQEDPLSGPCGAQGDNLTWALSQNGALTISGQGDMAEYAWNSAAPWAGKEVDVASLTVEEGVTSIGSYAFSKITTLTSASLPSTLTQIGDGAFANCSHLKYIRIPANCTSFGENAFPANATLLVDYYSDAMDYVNENNCDYIPLVEGFNG